MDDSELHGLFGGAFDPIHRGHLAPVAEAMRAAKLASVTYLPTNAPAHRPPPVASAQHRYAMTRIAVDAIANCTACDIELQREGRSYTIDTLHELRARHPQRRYALLLGLDAALQLANWHRWRELQRAVHIIALTRPGYSLDTPPRWWRDALVDSSDELRHADGGRLLLVPTAPVAISATMVRARLRAGVAVDDLLPDGVLDYIRAHGLYRA